MGHLFPSNRRLAWHHRSTAMTSSFMLSLSRARGA